jgi:7-carboxy-7-deazaguanine synthase (Cx14CxxC type)
MAYKVKEIFYTLQGEGTHAGRPAVFCRFSLCNLWTGRESDRPRAICKFCDTDFIGTDGPGGGTFETPEALALAVSEKWPLAGVGAPMVVCTGGEPLLQLDEPAIRALREAGFYVAVETNGTQEIPNGIDWACVSPKVGSTLIAKHGNELKLVYPQEDCSPDEFENLDFETFRIQPMDGKNIAVNTAAAVEYCLRNPRWSLSLQTHKYLGIP